MVDKLNVGIEVLLNILYFIFTFMLQQSKNGSLEKTINIPTLLQPSAECQKEKSLFRSG
jgi:hypothetical protein